MNKNEINNMKLDNSNNNKIERNKNNITDKSKEITNNKYISKGKNKEKRNRNILPPQEEPTVENGGFLNELEANFPSLRTQPRIKDISFLRPNLEKLYMQGIELEMYAYVDEKRKKDGKYTLYNLCSESMFISDHVIVRDTDGELEMRVGQCIKFNGMVYKYGDKYSVSISNVEDIGSVSLRVLKYSELYINDEMIDEVFNRLSSIEVNKQYEIMKSLCERLNTYSCQMFGSKKFIIGMIFDFFFMRSKNENLSSNKYLNDLAICTPISIMILSDILYRIEIEMIKDFLDLRNRVIQIATLAQGIDDKNINNNHVFNRFCTTFRINRAYGKQYVKDVYKRYKLKNVIENSNKSTLNFEMRFATACIISNF